jgi:hypothetical protein
MESLKKPRAPLVVGIIGLVGCCVLALNVGHAEMPLKPSANQIQIQKKEKVSATSALKGCPDLKVNLNVVKSGSGLVALSSTVSNVGSAYPPKTYNQVGVSEQLGEKAFTQVRKGTFFPINCSFQIPDFAGWATPGAPGNAKRLFTLRVAKKNMAPFAVGEDCDPNNNSKWVEVTYQEQPN